MKTFRPLTVLVLVLPLLAVPCTGAPAASVPENNSAGQAVQPTINKRISAADSCFKYDGRFDFSDSNAPVVIWQASRIRTDFDGDALTLLFDDAKGQNFFNAQVDQSNTIVALNQGAALQPVTLSGLGPGTHELTLFKRSEAAAGTVRFRGIEIAPTATVRAPQPKPGKLKMIFIGDSITVGACNEDGPADQWATRRTHNSAFSYATLTAAAFGADYRNIAVSGMGIETGWVEPKAGEIWNRLYPDPASPPASLSGWIPRVVFLNFGENDGSFSSAHGRPFPTNFTAGYVALVQAIRKGWPAAEIVLLRGGMSNGANNVSLHRAWDSAASLLEANDKAVSHFAFKHWTVNHPRVADDRIMADELVAWLKQQPFMRPYR
jgi:lysophospholipase L1-like esterase